MSGGSAMTMESINNLDWVSDLYRLSESALTESDPAHTQRLLLETSWEALEHAGQTTTVRFDFIVAW